MPYRDAEPIRQAMNAEARRATETQRAIKHANRVIREQAELAARLRDTPLPHLFGEDGSAATAWTPVEPGMRMARDGDLVTDHADTPRRRAIESTAASWAGMCGVTLFVGGITGSWIIPVVVLSFFAAGFTLPLWLRFWRRAEDRRAGRRRADRAHADRVAHRAMLQHQDTGDRYAGRQPSADYSRNELITYALTLDTDTLRRTLYGAQVHAAALADERRQAAIDAYEAHITDANWRATPGVAWMRREAELRAALPADYPLPDGVTR